MTASHARNGTKTPSGSSGQSLVLYGLDELGKARAACFAAKDAALARKAAGLMGLKVLPVASPQQVEIAARLPTGRLYSSGRGLVPNIRSALYGKLVAAANGANGNGQNGKQEQKSGSGQNPSDPAGKCPPKWNAIDVGHVVIAPEEDKELGWSEANVVRKNGDMFTLRWQSPPNRRLITRHRLNLGLPYPNGQGAAPSHGAEPNKPAASRSNEAEHNYPTDWSEIDVGSVVLAKEDGPVESWWEAVVTAKDGDSFAFQWRENMDLPSVVRPRTQLALLCPTSLTAAKSG
jgi:hypothetical protein